LLDAYKDAVEAGDVPANEDVDDAVGEALDSDMGESLLDWLIDKIVDFLKEQLGAAREKTDEPVDENDPMAKLLKEFESYLGDKVMDMAGDIAKDVIKDTIGMATSGNDD
jgi:hypothetical protein